MSKPAARQGDMTTHGGVITIGNPTVLIGGQPAARMGDMHTCPLVSPGPVPHVGGPISMGSIGVMIGGSPAARVGDLATCTGPPDSIAMGCPTVLIGGVAGGGGAGAGGGGGGSGNAVAAEETSSADSGAGGGGGAGSEGDGDADAHFLDVSFVDKGGFPITGMSYKMKSPEGQESSGPMMGTIKQNVASTGNYDIDLVGIINANWSTERAKVGDSVTMSAEAVGIEEGTVAAVELCVYDPNFATRVLKSFPVPVSGNKIDKEWTVAIDSSYLQIQDEKVESAKYSAPLFFFKVRIGDNETRSGFLTVVDDIEFNLKDHEGNPLADRKYKLFTCTGEIREGQLDGSGHGEEKDVPAGRVRVYVDMKDDSFSGGS